MDNIVDWTNNRNEMTNYKEVNCYLEVYGLAVLTNVKPWMYSKSFIKWITKHEWNFKENNLRMKLL